MASVLEPSAAQLLLVAAVGGPWGFRNQWHLNWLVTRCLPHLEPQSASFFGSAGALFVLAMLPSNKGQLGLGANTPSATKLMQP